MGERKPDYDSDFADDKVAELHRESIRAALQVGLDWATVREKGLLSALHDLDAMVEQARESHIRLKIQQEEARENLHRNTLMGQAVLRMANEAGIHDMKPTEGLSGKELYWTLTK